LSESERRRWDERYRRRGAEAAAASPFLDELDGLLPRQGRALDVAGGAGRHARWLARRGLAVTLVDISSEALALAGAGGVPLTLIRADLETDPLPPGPFDVVVSCHFLRRELFAAFPTVLAPGGLLVYVQPTRSNLLRHPSPSARFLLEDGELPGLVQGLEILRYQEGWFGQHEARLVARRP
jgi:tellurite methyltransferase